MKAKMRWKCKWCRECFPYYNRDLVLEHIYSVHEVDEYRYPDTYIVRKWLEAAR